MNFVDIKRVDRKGTVEIYPEFLVDKNDDLMIRGSAFYAVWDEAAGMWSTDPYTVKRLVDNEMFAFKESLGNWPGPCVVKSMKEFSSKSWSQFVLYTKSLPDNYHQLDESLTWQNTEVKKTDYVSKRLPYPLVDGPHEAYDELMSTLYDPEERAKLEWAIGSIVAGDSKKIQKFIVLYGEGGSGKSTVLDIIGKLFAGYTTSFDAKALASNTNIFATDVFRGNPLVALQDDGNLSNIKDNTKLNSIISHGEMVMNEKFKSSYTSKTNCFLFMGSNEPVAITNAKSGIIRRLIDVKPSGRTLPPDRYFEVVEKIGFELSGIAWHCLQVYKSMGKNYYSNYKPLEMMYQTDAFFNFVDAKYLELSSDEGISLMRAYELYNDYCDMAHIETRMPRHIFRGELKNYYECFDDRIRNEDGTQTRSWYHGFRMDRFEKKSAAKDAAKTVPKLELTSTESIFDKTYADQPAQYANADGAPMFPWSKVTTRLRDIDTAKLHYVLLPSVNHIFMDFDLKDENGNKSKELNLEAAARFPKTYSEFSKGGEGVHSHYIYEGDATQLAPVYSPGIEIKISKGKTAVRRRLSYCNDIPIATISSGLPMKGEKKVPDTAKIRTAKKLFELILRTMNKEFHAGTKPAVDFIKKLTDEAYSSDLSYDLTSISQMIHGFCASSTHNKEYCLNVYYQLHLMSKDVEDKQSSNEGFSTTSKYEDDRFVFFDVEVFPNVCIVVWKFARDPNCSVMINPLPVDIERLFQYKLIGFNNRKYDNHILWCIYLGCDNATVYDKSRSIIAGEKDALYREAYNKSYTDIYDFSSEKKSLKKFEIALGIHHQELNFRWDEPVPEDKWQLVAEYCKNDVLATEALFYSPARQADFQARLILSELSGLTPNDTTNQHTTRIIFGNNRNPKLEYTDLSTVFPGYSWTKCEEDKVVRTADGSETKHITTWKNLYRGIDVGRGGYVYARPGMYLGEIVTFDVASMHPHSIKELNAFGAYTKNFTDLMDTRIFIKHKDFESAKKLFGGKLAPYLDDPSKAKALSGALKIAINSVYGLTSAAFSNPFKDPRNVNNIVALRGALFMKTLQDEVESMGGTVIHIKTDSIKILRPTPEIYEFVMNFGKKYGYEFEIEHIFDRLCLVNDAVYIGRISENDPDESARGTWEATGKEFAVPYIFKTLFSNEELLFPDFCETKETTSAIYLDFNEGLPEGEHNYIFVGKVGSFVPVRSGTGGAIALREQGDKYVAIEGTSGYRWREAEEVRACKLEETIDMSYFEEEAGEAMDHIAKFGNYDVFVSDDCPPWVMECNGSEAESCFECKYYSEEQYRCTWHDIANDISTYESELYNGAIFERR